MSVLALALGAAVSLPALDRPEITFPVFQFPADAIPRVDGEAGDWAMVPDSYAIRAAQFTDDTGRYPAADPANLDFTLKVGWVRGLNQLYFLYEATDDCWDFAQPDLHNDTLEIVLDGDASGGLLVGKKSEGMFTAEEAGVPTAATLADPRISLPESNWAVQGTHAQNYHIFTPAVGKDWCLAWNAATWTKELPYANAVTRHTLQPGKGGKLVLEFWLTPFDYAGAEGPQRAVASVLRENKILGLGIIVIDYDEPAGKKRGFWRLGTNRNVWGNASRACAFRLMPLEPQYAPKFQARWDFTVVNAERRVVAFRDASAGEVTTRRWDFGDGETSAEANPIHTYREWRPNYVVTLEIEGPAGKSRWSRVWDVQMR